MCRTSLSPSPHPPAMTRNETGVEWGCDHPYRYLSSRESIEVGCMREKSPSSTNADAGRNESAVLPACQRYRQNSQTFVVKFAVVAALLRLLDSQCMGYMAGTVRVT